MRFGGRGRVLVCAVVALAIGGKRADAQCADPWAGATQMTGTFMVTGVGSGPVGMNGSLSLNHTVTGSPVLPVLMGVPGMASWSWTGAANASVDYHLTTTDTNGTTTIIGNGAGTNAAGMPAKAFMTIDPVACTYSISVDGFVPVVDTDPSGTMTPSVATWGVPPGGFQLAQEPLPMTGNVLSGSKTIIDTTSYPGVSVTWTLTWSLTGTQNCKVTLPVHYRQGAAPWGPMVYATSGATIGALGCAMTSMTMAMIYAGWDGYHHDGSTDPGTVNSLMLQAHDFNGRSVMWDPAVRDLSSGLLKYAAGPNTSSNSDVHGARKILDDALCSDPPFPVIVGVKLTTSDSGAEAPGHFVLVIAKTDNDYTIADPATGADRPLSDYGAFQTRGVVKDPPGDLSQLDLAVDDHAALVVTDPAGNISGVDARGAVVQNIPRSAAWVDEMVDEVDDTNPPTDNYYVQMFQPVSGDYKVVVHGLTAGAFTLAVHGFTQNATAQAPLSIDGTITPGSERTYIVHYSAADGSTTTVDISNEAQGCGCRAGSDPRGAMVMIAFVLACRRRRDSAR